MKHKHCPGCREVKSLEQFTRRVASWDGLAPRCKTCLGKTACQRYAAKPERQKRASYKRYWENPQRAIDAAGAWRKANRERARETVRRRRASHPELRRAWEDKNREKIKVSVRAHYAGLSPQQKKERLRRAKRSPDYRVAQMRASSAYKARKRKLRSDLTHEQWQQTLEDFGHHCAYCGVHRVFCGVLHQEHAVPALLGGGYTQGNIVPACGTCNNSKFTKTAVEFIWQRACA